MRSTALILLAALALVPAAVPAQTYLVQPVRPAAAKASDDVRYAKAALAGREIRIWAASLLQADCTPAGTMETHVVEPPKHGQLRLSHEDFYPNYPEGNLRSVCDARKAPGRQAFYTSEPGFHGHDRIVLQNATSEGRMRRVTIDVAVD